MPTVAVHPTHSPAWLSLDDAYGPATALPVLLDRLLAWSANHADHGEPWPHGLAQDLWSRLCHQGTVYTASYAAFPTLVEAIERCGATVPADLLALVVCIDRSRRDGLNGPKVPRELGKPYVKALIRLPALMVPVMLHAPDEELTRAALGAYAAAAGYGDLSGALLDLDAAAIDHLLHRA